MLYERLLVTANGRHMPARSKLDGIGGWVCRKNLSTRLNYFRIGRGNVFLELDGRGARISGRASLPRI